jgi:glucokinase
VASEEAGDEHAASESSRAERSLAAGIASLNYVLSPEIVVLGGGIARAAETLFVPLRREMADVEWRPLGQPVPIVPAELGEFAGAIGAARYAMLAGAT